MNTRLSYALAALLIASAPAAWAAQQAPDPPKVTVAQARTVRMAPKIALPGTVVAHNDSHLASEVEGRVAWVADVGTAVAANDVVARIDNNLAATQLASDKANVARLAASLRFNRDQAARMQNLFDANAIAKSTRDQAVSQRDMTAAELAQARAQLSRTQYQYDHGQIRAPFPGRVVARLIQPGEYATAGKEIVRLVDIDSLEVRTQAPIESAHYLRDGMPITVEIDKRPISATVLAIVPVGDELSRTIEVRLALAPGAAYVGDAARVFLPSAEPRNVLAVPRDALVLREDNTYVFKVNPKSVAQRVAVETGTEDGTLVEVRGLIKAGERVIISGAERLEAGQKVRAVGAS